MMAKKKQETSMKLRNISIKSIVPNPKQPRMSFRKIEEMADNIMEIGLINPVSVKALRNGKHELISGERRWQAYCILAKRRPVSGKYLRIPAIVKKPSPYEMVAENLVRDEMSLLEKIEAVSVVLKKQFGLDFGKSLSRIHNMKLGEKEAKIIKACKSLGMGPTYIYLCLPVLKLNKSTKKTILKNRDYFTDGVVRKLASIQEMDTTEIAKSIVREKMTSKEAFKSIRLSWAELKGLNESDIAWDDFIFKWEKNYFSTLKLIKQIGSKKNLREAPTEQRKRLRLQLRQLDLAIGDVLY